MVLFGGPRLCLFMVFGRDLFVYRGGSLASWGSSCGLGGHLDVLYHFRN